MNFTGIVEPLTAVVSESSDFSTIRSSGIRSRLTAQQTYTPLSKSQQQKKQSFGHKSTSVCSVVVLILYVAGPAVILFMVISVQFWL